MSKDGVVRENEERRAAYGIKVTDVSLVDRHTVNWVGQRRVAQLILGQAMTFGIAVEDGIHPAKVTLTRADRKSLAATCGKPSSPPALTSGADS
ncbi:MAG: hypothetical protein ABIR57_10460 [Aeromicrobium sp.]